MTNYLDRVEPHAKRLEEAADKMEHAGIGGHSTRGHVHVLRQMAAGLRGFAAQGRLPDRFDWTDACMASAEVNGRGHLYAVGDNPGEVRIDMSKPVQLTLAVAAQADHGVRKLLVERVMAQAKTVLGVDLNPNAVLDSYEISRLGKKNGASTDALFRLKDALHQVGCL